MAISVDMDNMEAALFSSFSSKQQGKRGRKRAQEPEKVDNDMSLHKEDRKDEKIISNMKTNAKESRVKPRTFEFSEDDLAGLLSDSDSDNQLVKKPVLRQKNVLSDAADADSRTTISEDNNPITSVPVENVQLARSDERVQPSFISPVITKGGTESRKGRAGIAAKTKKAGTVIFNDDDADTDDLLGDLGLGDDDNEPAPSRGISSRATAAVSVPALQKSTLNTTKNVVQNKTRKNDVFESDNDISDKDDGGNEFSFGSYLPSVSSSTPARKREVPFSTLSAPLKTRSLSATSSGKAKPADGEDVEKVATSSTKKLVRFALQENDRDIGEEAKPPGKTESRTLQQERTGPKLGEPSKTTVDFGMPARDQSLPVATAGSKQSIFHPMPESSTTVESYISPSAASSREEKVTLGRHGRRRSKTNKSKSGSLFESDDDTPNEPDSVKAIQLSVRTSNEKLGQKESRDQDPRLHPAQLTHSPALKAETEARDSNPLQLFTQSSSLAGLQPQDVEREVPRNGGLENESLKLQKRPLCDVQGVPGVEDLELKQTNAALQKQLEKICEELASERTENEKLKEVLSSLQSTQSDHVSRLSSEVEERRIKLHSAELEKQQLLTSLESCKRHHSEELQTMEDSARRRIQALEEAHVRTEERWKSEVATAVDKQKERAEDAEREGREIASSLRKQLESLEVARSSELARLKEVHGSVIESLRREHEREVEDLKRRHENEIAAMKEAHSHTRMLSELSQQVETSVQKVSHLQARLGETHERQNREKEHGLLAKEHQLTVLEEQLEAQKFETTKEQQRLHSLIAMLETQLSEKQRDVDKERWQLHQEQSRLKAQRCAFENERETSLQRTQDDRDQLQQAKEKFLKEQQTILSQCYLDRHSLSSERAEVATLEKFVKDREQKDSFRMKQLDAREQELSQQHQMFAMERQALLGEVERMRVEQERTEEERRKIVAAQNHLELRTQEVENASQMAEQLHMRSQQALQEAHRRQLELSQQLVEINKQQEQLREKEMNLARERLSLLKDQRAAVNWQKKYEWTATDGSCREQELTLERVATSATPFQDEHLAFLPARAYLSSSSPPNMAHPPNSSHLLQSHGHDCVSPASSSGLVPSATGCVPFLLDVSSASPRISSDISGDLADLQLQQTLRQLTAEVEKDCDALEEERRFLETVQLSKPSRPLFIL